jgi:hypothetical protein
MADAIVRIFVYIDCMHSQQDGNSMYKLKVAISKSVQNWSIGLNVLY